MKKAARAAKMVRSSECSADIREASQNSAQWHRKPDERQVGNQVSPQRLWEPSYPNCSYAMAFMCSYRVHTSDREVSHWLTGCSLASPLSAWLQPSSLGFLLREGLGPAVLWCSLTTPILENGNQQECPILARSTVCCCASQTGP